MLLSVRRIDHRPHSFRARFRMRRPGFAGRSPALSWCRHSRRRAALAGHRSGHPGRCGRQSHAPAVPANGCAVPIAPLWRVCGSRLASHKELVMGHGRSAFAPDLNAIRRSSGGAIRPARRPNRKGLLTGSLSSPPSNTIIRPARLPKRRNKVPLPTRQRPQRRLAVIGVRTGQISGGAPPPTGVHDCAPRRPALVRALSSRTQVPTAFGAAHLLHCNATSHTDHGPVIVRDRPTSGKERVEPDTKSDIKNLSPGSFCARRRSTAIAELAAASLRRRHRSCSRGWDLPPYNEDIDTATEVPAPVSALRGAASGRARCLAVAAGPRYSAVIKNAIDWLSRPFLGDAALKDSCQP